MNELNIKGLMATILDCLELHMRSSKDWHFGEPAYETDEVPEVEGLQGLRELVMRQHWTAFRLHHLREEGGSPTRVEIMEGKLERITAAVGGHAKALLGEMGHDCPDLNLGAMMLRMSELSLQTYHLKEAADEASHEAAHHSDDNKVLRKADRLLEKVGELDTLRMVHGREMLDAIMGCAGNMPE